MHFCLQHASENPSKNLSKTTEFQPKVLFQIGLLLKSFLEPENYRFLTWKCLNLGPQKFLIFFYFSGQFSVLRPICRHTYLEDDRQIDPDRFWSPTWPPKQTPTSQFAMLFQPHICIQSVIDLATWGHSFKQHKPAKTFLQSLTRQIRPSLKQWAAVSP